MIEVERPELVRSVTVAEPPLLHWLQDLDRIRREAPVGEVRLLHQ